MASVRGGNTQPVNSAIRSPSELIVHSVIACNTIRELKVKGGDIFSIFAGLQIIV